jgi:hypothetical protein
MKTENRSIWLARFGSEAGSEASTNCRWWDSIRFSLAGVGGI